MKKLSIGLIFALCGLVDKIAAQELNYSEALQKSIYFYEAQVSGRKPAWNRVPWRRDSALNDGRDVGFDLSGGWHDAGDHVKFGLPMAFSATMLGWGVYEYGNGYQNSDQLPHILNNLKHVNDYFLKAFVDDRDGSYKFFGQVGAGDADHNGWYPAEEIDTRFNSSSRPSFALTPGAPGSEVTGETAASLAVASIIFRRHGATIGVPSTYADLLLGKARKMYNFADKYQGGYTRSISDAAKFYNSYSGFRDELAWGAAWLHLAEVEARTGGYTNNYLRIAENHANQIGTGHWFAWDDKSAGAKLLIAKINDNADQLRSFESSFFGQWLGTVPQTSGGLRFLARWGSLRYASNAAFLGFVYGDFIRARGQDGSRYINFAKSQIDYALGKNPRNSSYMVGFGNNPPTRPHHRSATGAPYIENKPESNVYILYGALVGGPKSTSDFDYSDLRNDYIANEVATDYNAAFTGALARLSRDFGGSIFVNFPNLNERKTIGTGSSPVATPTPTITPVVQLPPVSPSPTPTFTPTPVTAPPVAATPTPTRTPTPPAPPPIVSTPTPTPTPAPITPPPAGVACLGRFTIANSWNGGYQANVSLRNLSGTPINGFTLRFNLQSNNTVSQLWNATYSQVGSSVTVSNPPGHWNGVLQPNASNEVTFGLVASSNGAKGLNGAMTLNGTPCTMSMTLGSAQALNPSIGMSRLVDNTINTLQNGAAKLKSHEGKHQEREVAWHMQVAVDSLLKTLRQFESNGSDKGALKNLQKSSGITMRALTVGSKKLGNSKSGRLEKEIIRFSEVLKKFRGKGKALKSKQKG